MAQGHYDLYNYIYNEINRESRNILVRRDRFIAVLKAKQPTTLHQRKVKPPTECHQIHT